MMRYKFIKRGQHMPKDTEIFRNGKWVPYYANYRWALFEKNCLYTETELRRPLKSSKQRKTKHSNNPSNSQIADKLEVFYSTRPHLTREDIHKLEAVCRQLRAGNQ